MPPRKKGPTSLSLPSYHHLAMAPDRPSGPPLWSLPKPQRPPHGSLLHGLCWAAVFNTSILLTNLLQLLSYPLSLFAFTRPFYADVIRFTKGTLLIGARREARG